MSASETKRKLLEALANFLIDAEKETNEVFEVSLQFEDGQRFEWNGETFRSSHD